jgi:hypothetical protein
MSLDTDAELSAQLEATQDLIASRPTPITLFRPAAPVSDGAGGTLRPAAPTALATVERYFGGPSLSIRSGIITHQGGHDDGGVRHEAHWVLAGPPDDDIQDGDTFVYDGRNFKVERVSADRSYVTRASVLEVTGGI